MHGSLDGDQLDDADASRSRLALVGGLDNAEQLVSRYTAHERSDTPAMATAAAAAAMPPPHPHLSTPILYLSGVPSSVADEDIVEALRDCLRLRLFLKRDEADRTLVHSLSLRPSELTLVVRAGTAAAPLTGKVEFESLEKAECAYATCNGQRLSSGHTLALTLSPPSSSPSNPDPEPRATPRIIKQLPRTFTASQVFALCRPFGPIHSASLLLSPSPQATAGGGPPRFKGQALVTFYDELDAVEMQNALHFAEVGGQNVAVQVWDAKRGAATKARASLGTLPTTTTASPRLSPNEKVSRWAAATQQQHATPSKPSRYAGLGASSPSSLPSTPMRRDVSNASSTASRWSSDGGVGGGGAASEGGGAGTDPRAFLARRLSTSPPGNKRQTDLPTYHDAARAPGNLFIKNLDASFSTADLRALFVPFGALTSASVALDPARGKASKGFGFVAFERREDAERARREVDGRAVRGKRVVVRVHERKEVRRERLERAFAAAAGAGAGPVDEVRAGVEGLSTGVRSRLLPDSTLAKDTDLCLVRHKQPTTPSSSPRAFKPVSPLSPADSPPSSRSTAPASGEQSEHDRLVAAVGDVLGAGESEKRDEVVRLIEGVSLRALLSAPLIGRAFVPRRDTD